ncbi:hypothetical protein StoSoilB22_21530 [Arthrobacter sp. StoSoilB22]|nr:hypothetical protein StoSoilB22_21530 [Arthrobacter sp. StoSoilB22]
MERRAGNVQVVIAESGLSLRAQDVAARGASRAGTGLGHTLDFDYAVALQVVKVAADCGRCEAEEVAELRGAHWTVFQNGA